MAGMFQAWRDILTTPLGAIVALVAIVVVVLFVRWVFKEQPQK